MCPTKLLIILIIKRLFYSEINAILRSIFSGFPLFYLILENMSTVVFLVIFDTFDVKYNLSISLLSPVVLDNLFDFANYSF